MLAGAAGQLSAACQQQPGVAAKTLEWLLRGCFRVTVGNMSYRSCSRGAEGTCKPELEPANIPPGVQRAAAAAAGTEAEGSLSECYDEGLGGLVLLCHRVVLGVTAAPWQQGNSTASCSTARKRQVSLLNSCLKLLNRLAAPPTSTGNESGTGEEQSDDSSCGSGCNSASLSAAGKWMACQTAAAIAGFGTTLVCSTGGERSDSGSGPGGKLEDAGWSMAARGLLFVSRHLTEGCMCRESPAQTVQQRLLESITSSCLQLQAKASQLPSHKGRKRVRTLKEQVRGLVDDWEVCLLAGWMGGSSWPTAALLPLLKADACLILHQPARCLAGNLWPYCGGWDTQA